ncbi:hypothetical protein Tco_0153253 [Tanacetum coccineum]
MELLMIEGKTLKGRRDPLGIITNDRKAGIGSPHTEDQTMDCSLTCPKAQERSSPQKRQLRVSNSLLICLEADGHETCLNIAISMKTMGMTPTNVVN